MSKPVAIGVIARAFTPEKLAQIAEKSEMQARPYLIEQREDFQKQEQEEIERREFFMPTGVRKNRSRMRDLLAHRDRVFKLTQFAKNFLYRYLNSELDVEQVVDELTSYRERGMYGRRFQAIQFAKSFLFTYLNTGKDPDDVVKMLIS